MLNNFFKIYAKMFLSISVFSFFQSEAKCQALIVKEMVPTNMNAEIQTLFQDMCIWPTDLDKNRLSVPQSEIKDSLPAFDRWVKRILKPAFIPQNLSDLTIGLRKWKNGKEDVLLASYSTNNVDFRILDLSRAILVEMKSTDFPDQVEDWNWFVNKEILEKFIMASARLQLSQNLVVTKIPSLQITRVELNLSKPQGSQMLSELWCAGNPWILILSQTVIIGVGKRFGGEFPVEEDYGITQRFPPLRNILKNKSLEEVVGYLVEAQTPAERVVAISSLCERDDVDFAIPMLISVYEDADTDNLKMYTIQILELLASKVGGSSIDQVKELARLSLLKQDSTKLKSVLSKVVENLERGQESADESQ